MEARSGCGGGLPVIDLSQDEETISRLIMDACTTFGFFYIKNHGVPQDLVDNLMAESKRFFAKPEAFKNKINMKRSGLQWRGYFALGDELTSGKPDHKEGLYFGENYPENHPFVLKKYAMHGENQYPSEDFPQYAAFVESYMEHLTELGHRILRAIAVGLHLPEDYFRKLFCLPKPFTPFRIFMYPADPVRCHKDGTERWGVAEHTDYGFLTILKQDEVGGLEVENRNGEYISAPPIPGTLVCNIGDCLEAWTKGLLKATPHRVRSSPTHDRISMPFFFDPAFAADMGDLMVGSTGIRTYGDYITEKVKRVFPELFQSSSSRL